MRAMTFIRGEFAICPDCADPVSVDKDVVKIRKGPMGPIYMVVCDCGANFEYEVSREQHDAAVNFLNQIAEDRAARDKVTVPVTPEEEDLLEFANALDQMGSADDLISQWG